MEIYLGITGLDKSKQDAFPETVDCNKCYGKAQIMFVAVEVEEENYISGLHKSGGFGSYWPHDACAVAVYLCRDCRTPVAQIDQA